MKSVIPKIVARVARKAALLLLLTMAAQSLYALDYPEAGDFSAGSKAWSENCTRCHNMRSPRDLRDDQWVTSVFHMRVRAGLSGQETRDILTFLQSSNARVESVGMGQVNSSATEYSDISGEQIYESNCLACHGANGKGNIPGVPDFTVKNGRLLKDDGELLGNIIRGIQSPGSSMPMPPRGGNSRLSNSELDAALKYIKKSFSE